MGPYKICKQYLKRNITLTKARCYISLEDMAAYTLAEARQIPEKIDLVYLWRNKTSEGVNFGHTLQHLLLIRSGSTISQFLRHSLVILNCVRSGVLLMVISQMNQTKVHILTISTSKQFSSMACQTIAST